MGIFEQDMIIYIWVAIAIWNFITFIIYSIDKSRAAKGKWRTSEATLLACAFLMGGFGAALGMRLLRHKTKHLKFKILMPLAIIVNIGVVVLILIWRQVQH